SSAQSPFERPGSPSRSCLLRGFGATCPGASRPLESGPPDVSSAQSSFERSGSPSHSCLLRGFGATCWLGRPFSGPPQGGRPPYLRAELVRLSPHDPSCFDFVLPSPQPPLRRGPRWSARHR